MNAPTSIGVVTPIMARLVSGDAGALADLHAVAAGPLRARLRRRVGELGGWLNPGDLDGLVLDAVLELARLAPSWRADGGALPWTWASRRLDALATAFVGQHTDPLGDDEPPAAPPAPSAPPEGDSRSALRRLRAVRPEAAVLDAALRTVATERDAVVWLDAHRDSPAAAARLHGIRGDHARQISHRVGRRLRRLATTDPAFAALAALPALAA